MAKKTRTSTAAKTASAASTTPRAYRALLWALLAGTWLLVAASLISFDPADPLPAGWTGQYVVAAGHTHAHNWVGRFGAEISHEAYLMLGPGVWVLMAGTLAWLVALVMRRRVTQPVLRALGLIIATVTASGIIGLTGWGTGWLSAYAARPEGLVAYWMNTQLTPRFNTLGSLVIVVVGFWVGLILAADQLVMALGRGLGRMFGLLGKSQLHRLPKAGVALAGRLQGVPLPWTLGRDEAAGTVKPTATSSRSRRHRNEIEDDPNATDDAVPAEVEAVADDEPAAAAVTDDDDASETPGDAPGAYVAQKNQFDPDALRRKIKQLPINFAPRATAPAKPREVDLSGYRFPGLDLLLDPEGNFTDEMEAFVREQAMALESALQQYRIEGGVVGIDTGPVITLYEVRLAPGTKVSQLGAIASDLARALKAQNIRIVPNTAGKDTVGVEVPNLKKEKVRLKELMTAHEEMARKMKLPMFLGKDASGSPLIQDLAAMPHMLIAGTTGSGKSVCMNAIIMSFLYTRRPDELRLVLVDPKMVEMAMFKDIPHLMCPVVTEMGKAASILEWATTKMDERYELLAEAGVRDIAGYNALSWEDLKERFKPSNEDEEAQIPKKLPYLVFVIDELADLIITNKEVEGFIVRLAQKARAVGLHLILATQRPQANVVTGLIKGNMPCRIGFKVASALDSRIVLDQKGAELLLGQGDMLFLSPRTSKLVRAQGTYVDDLEIRRSVKFLAELAEQNFEPQLVQLRGSGGGSDDGGERDPLFDDAVRVVLQTKRGSVSLLQRRLTIGYSRASRLIEQMYAAGIIGEYKGSQAREVVMTLDEYEAIKAQAEADAAQGMVGLDSAAADDSDDDGDDDEVPDEFADEYKQ